MRTLSANSRLVFWVLGEDSGRLHDEPSHLFFVLDAMGRLSLWVAWSRSQVKGLLGQLIIADDELDELNNQFQAFVTVWESQKPPLEIRGIAANAFHHFVDHCRSMRTVVPEILVPKTNTICGLIPPSADASGQIVPKNTTFAYIDEHDLPHIFVFSCVRDVRNHLNSLWWIDAQWRQSVLKKLSSKKIADFPWVSSDEPLHVTGFAARILCGFMQTYRVITRVLTSSSQGDA